MSTTLKPAIETGNWTDNGNCRNPEQYGISQEEMAARFFPKEYAGAPADIYAPAKAVCADCPVKDDCLEDALAKRDRDGVWGGTDWSERSVILKARDAAAKS